MTAKPVPAPPSADTLTLDPTDWEVPGRVGRQMLDDMLAWMRALPDQPVWRPIPDTVRAALREALPREPQALDQVYREFRERILPYTGSNAHPRFWGWVMGNGSVEGMLAGMLEHGLNLNNGGTANSAGAWVELQVLDWCKAMVDFPGSASAALVSGGSMANYVALAAARDAAAGDAVDAGLHTLEQPLVFYCSSETHMSVHKGLRLLGLGRAGLRIIPADRIYRMDLEALERQIAADRAAGLRPACVIGNAGTVNTGAFDNLTGLLAICRREGMWFHVDGAFGALANLSPRFQPMLRGMAEADSVAFDLHKWLHVPYEAGCVVVRDPEAHRRPFAEGAAYLAPFERGYVAGPGHFADFAPELSRGFRALRVWLSFKAHGVRTYARLIEQNIDQARELAMLVLEDDELELLAPVSLNIVCFRYRQPGLADPRLDAVNQEIMLRLQEEGVAVMSSTSLGGRFALRVAVTNHRSRWEDFSTLVEAVKQVGREVVGELPMSATFPGRSPE